MNLSIQYNKYDHLIIQKLHNCLQSNLSFEINCTVYITYS
jgi:hypothetical protein